MTAPADAAVAGGGYLAGDRFSAADLSVGFPIGWGLNFCTIEPRPGFESYWAHVSDRDAYRPALEVDDALLAEAGGSPPG